MADTTHDSDVLTIQVLRDTPPIGRQGFGVPIIIGECSMSERVREYTSPAGASADVTAGNITQALADYVSAAFAQTLKPKKVLVGRREANVAQVVRVTVDGADDGDYEVTINGTTYSHTASGSTQTNIASALASLIDADSDVSATANTAFIDITASVAGDPFTVTVSAPEDNLLVTTTTPNLGLADELDEILAANSEWYGFALESRTDLDITAGLDWAAANGRFFAAETNTAAVKDGTAGNVALTAKSAQQKNGFIFYRTSSSSKAAWKLLTNRSAINLDQRTSIWSYVTLIGETVDTLTDTEKGNLQAANCMYYLTFKGTPCTRPGVNPAGEKIDVVWTAAWTKARIEERLAQVLLNAVNRGDKIPYDDTGFKLLEGEVRDVLQLGERAGHFSVGSTNVSFTSFADLTDPDKDARRAPFTFGGLLAGGVEEFEGTGYATTDENFLDALFADDE